MDCCINAWTVTIGVWLSADVSTIVAWFIEHRLRGGGWYCDWVNGKTGSSFASTLDSLKGLLVYQAGRGATPAIAGQERPTTPQ